MKLQKSVSNKIRGKVYEKWFINIPARVITQVGWVVGEEIKISVSNSKLILENQKSVFVKSNQNKKTSLTYYERFIKVYNNLPLDERKLPIIVVDDEAISWSRCYKEIIGKTKLGKNIGEKLIKLDII